MTPIDLLVMFGTSLKEVAIEIRFSIWWIGTHYPLNLLCYLFRQVVIYLLGYRHIYCKFDDFLFIYNNDPMTYWICTAWNKFLFSCNHIADSDKLISCLSENWIVTLEINLADLREKIFNPLVLNCEEQSRVPCGITIPTFTIIISSAMIQHYVIIIKKMHSMTNG